MLEYHWLELLHKILKQDSSNTFFDHYFTIVSQFCIYILTHGFYVFLDPLNITFQKNTGF